MIRLIADVGGTNARFALAEPGGALQEERHLLVRDHAGLAEAALAYLAGRPVTEAVIAVATPVESETIRFTNSLWSFSRDTLRARLGLDRLHVINDFAAQALAMPHLAAAELEPLGGGPPEPGRAAGVLGPGTGLGVSALVPGPRGWTALPGEGGHVSFAPGDARERALLATLSERFEHVSTERLLSGNGLLNIAQGLARIDGTACGADSPKAVTDSARDATCPACVEAVALFSAVLGSAAGDLALTLGARGGVFIAGGLSLRLGTLFDRAAFRRRFTAKGRMSAYLEGVPAWLVLRPDTGLIGAAHYHA